MGVEIVTKEDLQLFRSQLLDDIKEILADNKKSEIPEWLKSSEVIKLLKLSAGKLQTLRINRKVEGVKIEGTWYYSLKSIKRLFEV